MNNLFDFNRYTQVLHKLHQEYVELVPVKELWDLREFDRRSEPKWSQEDTDKTIEELKISIGEQGFKNPVRIEYYFKKNKAIIREGNHRLKAAMELGISHVPALVYVTDSIYFKANAKQLDMPSFPKSCTSDDLEPYYKPSQLNIFGCLNLQGILVKPDISWAHAIIEDFINDGYKETVDFKDIRKNIIDARIANDTTIEYNMSDIDDARKLYALFNNCTEYLEKNALQEIQKEIQDNTIPSEYVKIMSSRYEFSNVKGGTFGLDFRNYLIRLLVTNPQTTVSPSSAPDLTDLELLQEIESYEIYESVYKAIYKAFFNDWLKREALLRIKKFYEYDFELVNSGYFTLDNYDLAKYSILVMEISTEFFNKFQYIQEDDTSVKEILVREFSKQNYTASFDYDVRHGYYAYNDKAFTYNDIQTELKKIIK